MAILLSKLSLKFITENVYKWNRVYQMAFSCENYVSRDPEYTEKNEIWSFRGKNRSLLNARYWEYTDE